VDFMTLKIAGGRPAVGASLPRARKAWALTLVVLAGCGGGGGGGGGGDTTLSAAQTRPAERTARLLAVAAAPAAAQVPPTVGARELFDWAEFSFPTLFAKGPQNVGVQYLGQDYTVRAYPNGNYLGLRADGSVFGLGPFTDGALRPYGSLADFAGQVQADRCRVYPVTCGAQRTWAGATLMETNNDFNIKYGNAGPLSVVDTDGNALVLWEQSDGTPDSSTRKVYSRRYVAGQGWAPAAAIAGLTAYGGAIVVDGRLLPDRAGGVTWVDSSVGARRYTSAGGWSATVIRPAGSGRLAAAQIDAQGTIHALRSGDGNVWYATLPAGSSQWTAWVGISGTQQAVTGGVSLSVGAAGAVAVWRERNPGDSNDSIWSNRLAGGTWQAKVRIEELFTDVIGDTAVATDAAGNALAAWHQGNSLMVGRLDAARGSWSAPMEVDAGQVDSLFDARVGIVMHADGRAVVTWNHAMFALNAITYAPVVGFSAPATVANYSIDRTLAMDGDGKVVLVHRSDAGWPSQPSGIRLYSQQMPWGGSWTPATRLDSAAGSVLDDVSVALGATGVGVVAWAQNDSATTSVRNSLWSDVLR
jgi:hypothetical protein